MVCTPLIKTLCLLVQLTVQSFDKLIRRSHTSLCGVRVQNDLGPACVAVVEVLVGFGCLLE